MAHGHPFQDFHHDHDQHQHNKPLTLGVFIQFVHKLGDVLMTAFEDIKAQFDQMGLAQQKLGEQQAAMQTAIEDVQGDVTTLVDAIPAEGGMSAEETSQLRDLATNMQTKLDAQVEAGAAIVAKAQEVAAIYPGNTGVPGEPTDAAARARAGLPPAPPTGKSSFRS